MLLVLQAERAITESGAQLESTLKYALTVSQKLVISREFREQVRCGLVAGKASVDYCVSWFLGLVEPAGSLGGGVCVCVAVHAGVCALLRCWWRRWQL